MNAAHQKNSRDTAHAAGQRVNRNLSDAISHIRDDGPSLDAGEPAEVFRLHLTDAGNRNTGLDEPEIAVQPGRRHDRRRALPRVGIILRALAAFLLLTACAGMVLLASGKVPMLDDRGVYLADIPDGLVDDLVSIKLSVEDAYIQLSARIAPAFDALTTSATTDSAVQPATAPGERQQALLARLAALELQLSQLQDPAVPVPVETLQHRQDGLEHRLDAMQAQLDAIASRPVPAVAAPQSATSGEWVVNLASSGHKDRLQELQRNLQAAGVDTQVISLEQDSGTRYRLQAVGYASSGAAKRAAGELSREHDLPGAWAARSGR